MATDISKGVFYDGDEVRDRDVEHYENIPNRDEPTVENYQPIAQFDEPIPVRLVEDARPKQSITDWSATRYPVPPGEVVKLVGYVHSRKRVNLRTDHDLKGIYIGATEQVSDVKGYFIPGLEAVWIESPQPIYAYNPDSTDTINVCLLTETVVEIANAGD